MDIELLELRELAKKRTNDKNNEWMEPLTDPNIYCLMVFIALAVAFVLGGCQREPLSTKSSYVAKEGSFTARVYPEPLFGSQSVSLEWSFTKERPLGWFIRRTNLSTYETVLYVRDGGSSYFRDEYVSPGRYEYRLMAYDEKGERSMGSLVVTVYQRGVANE